ncbi:MAG: dihydroorotase [Gemmatimonadetes bacterium]|nr:dihydroorotase [Gemmatimonadota bacterium]MBK7924410.1 dihydroorotase [Gemmatimonadota bacterium]
MRPILIRGGRVIDPSRRSDGVADVYLVDGRVAAVGRNITGEDGCQVIEAKGRVVTPGLIDLHVHLREPGFEHVETVATGAMAAAAGGFTAVCAMPNTDPPLDNQGAVGFVISQAQKAGKARVYPVGTISLGQKGETLSEFGELLSAGAVAVSDDGKPIMSSHLMRTALEYAKTFGIPVADHCEEITLAHGGAMHEGIVATRLGLKGIPAAAEEIHVARDCILSELTGGHIHLCHMSTRGSVELIRRAKAKGLKVTAEVTPHHFTLNHESCEGYNTNAKMNPPLREPEDVEALREALKDGTVDVIATDHAPHHYDAKEREFDDAPNGILGLETAFGLAVTELVKPGLIPLPDLLFRMSTRAAQIYNLPGGTLAIGAPADVAILDPDAAWTVDPARFYSKSRNTPFGGRQLQGRCDLTIVRGRVVYDRSTE